MTGCFSFDIVDLFYRICAKIDFSSNALGIYAASNSELVKFSACSEINSQVKDCTADLFIPCNMPEAETSKSSFLQGVSTLFSGNQKETIDLDAICEFFSHRK
jgi:hypothetical protein